jgi:hypothetical protein
VNGEEPRRFSKHLRIEEEKKRENPECHGRDFGSTGKRDMAGELFCLCDDALSTVSFLWASDAVLALGTAVGTQLCLGR